MDLKDEGGAKKRRACRKEVLTGRSSSTQVYSVKQTATGSPAQQGNQVKSLPRPPFTQVNTVASAVETNHTVRDAGASDGAPYNETQFPNGQTMDSKVDDKVEGSKGQGAGGKGSQRDSRKRG